MLEIAALLFWFIVIVGLLVIIVVTPVLREIALIIVIGVGWVVWDHEQKGKAYAEQSAKETAVRHQQEYEQWQRSVARDREYVQRAAERAKQQIEQEGKRHERLYGRTCRHPRAAEWFAECRTP